jgi:hypothetical protein
MVYFVVLNEVKDLKLFNNTRFFTLLRMTISHSREYYKDPKQYKLCIFLLKAYGLKLTAYSL